MDAARSAEFQAFLAAGPLQRGAIAARVSAAARELPPGTRVLDAGAGNAPYRELFTHCDYRTQDWPASSHPGARHADIVADLHELPVRTGRFDFVLCTEVLEHLPEPGQALAEIRRILRPNGQLLITVPFVIELHEEPYDFFRYTPQALSRLLEQAGFAPPSIQPLTGWWSTLAHVLLHCGGATRPTEGAPAWATRAAAFAMRHLSALLAEAAPTLDRLDQRHALPIGWVSTTRVPPQTGHGTSAS